jgi:hypothetical protein
MAKKPKFLALKSKPSGQALGKAVGRVSRAVNNSKASPDEVKELKKFMNDPAGWLDGFVKIDDGTPKGKKVKGNLKVIPVFDSEDVMFVKVPTADSLGNLNAPAPNEAYANYADFLAKYFIRKCR